MLGLVNIWMDDCLQYMQVNSLDK